MRAFLSIALALALSGPSFACINDSELISHEREFKSQYQGTEYQPPQPSEVSTSQPYLMGTAGVLMLMAGTALFMRVRGQTR